MELFRFIAIHLIVPGLGVALYLNLVRKMLDREVREPPVVSLLIIFATWGTLLVLVLTAFFWYWSGMATLGFAYLFLLAPIVMGFIAVRTSLNLDLSKFHRGTFVASASYVGTIASFVGVRFLLDW